MRVCESGGRDCWNKRTEDGYHKAIQKLRFVDLRNRNDRVVIRLPRGNVNVLLRQQAVAFGPVDLEVALFDLVKLRPSRITSDAGSKANPLAVLDAKAYRVFLRDENVVPQGSSQGIARSLYHRIELLSAPRREVESAFGWPACFRDDWGEMRLTISGCEFAVGKKRWSTPLEVVSFLR